MIPFIMAKHLFHIKDDGVMRVQRVIKWRREFENSRKDNRNDDHTGRPSTARTGVNVARVEGLILTHCKNG